MPLGHPRSAIISPGGTTAGTPAQAELSVLVDPVTFVADESNPAIQSTVTPLANVGVGSWAGPKIGTVAYGAGWSSGITARFLNGYRLEVTFDPSGLAVGNYTASIPITDSNASNSPLGVDVLVTVLTGSRPAVIVASSRRLTVVATEGQDAPSQVITITNGGDLPFVNLAIANINESWIVPTLGVDETTGAITVTVAFETSALAAGPNTDGRFDIVADNASTVRVGHILTVVAAPANLVLSPSNQLTFTGLANGTFPADQFVAYTNSGGGSLGTLGFNTIQYAQPGNWLSGVFIMSSLKVSVDTTGVQPGTYTATWPLTATGAANSPVDLQVTLIVHPSPVQGTIQLNPSSLTFSATAGGGNPASQTVQITDGTGGGLGTVSLGTITYGVGWTSGVTASLDTQTNIVTVSVATGSLAAATYTFTIPVLASGASNSPQNITGSFIVSAAAAVTLRLTPQNVTFVAVAGGGDPAMQVVAIDNAGGSASLGTLGVGTITTSSGGAWCACVINGTNAEVTLTTGALTPGTRTATIPITSTTATNSPQNISVTFTVVSQVNATWVQPIYTLPTFTAYDPTDDLVKIAAGSAMDRAWNPPGGGSVTTVTYTNTGNVVSDRAANQAALQAEIDFRAGSNNGWTIKVTPGAADWGKINLPPRPSATANDIYIISTADALLPTPTYTNNGYVTGGTAHRVRPADASNLWKLRCGTGGNCITVSSAPNVCHYVLSGFDAAPTGAVNVQVLCYIAPSTGGTNIANYPNYITIDRAWIHNNGGWNANGTNYGIIIEAGYSKIRNCWIEGMGVNSESKAILCPAVLPGPLSVQNAYLNATGENLFIGGEDPPITNHVPSDVFIDNVHLYKSPEWNPEDASYNATYTQGVKNNLEYKFGDRFCAQRFVCEENWFGGQSGIAVVPKVVNPNGGSTGAWLYGRNWTFRHFAIYNSYGGFGLTGLTQRGPGNYTDEEISRPQRLDIHSGVIALGSFVKYGPVPSHTGGQLGTRNWHSQIICQSKNKDFRLKRISGVSADEPQSAWQFTGPNPSNDASDNGTWEDCTFQWGFASGSAVKRAYIPDGSGVVTPAEGDNVYRRHVINATVQRVGLFGNGSFPNTTYTNTLQPEHILLPSTSTAQVYQNYNSADPAGSDYTIIHSSLTTAGVNGTVCGADWAHLSAMLTGVRH